MTACVLFLVEAEYAFMLKKRIIPLKLQTGYEPLGWMTSVIGSRFYLTLTRDRSFEKQMSNLRDYIVSKKYTKYTMQCSIMLCARNNATPLL